MVSKVKGSAIDLGDLGIAYSVVDYGARITNTSGQNDTAITAALSAVATAGGGVVVIPHGISHSFDPLLDFPVTANALMVWELTGSKFKIYSNQEIDGVLGNTFAAAFFTTPSAIQYKIVDANPPTYTYTCEVYDDAGTPVISGSSFDLCWFLPGGTVPVMALARNGAKLGALFLFNGLDVTGNTATGSLTVTGTSLLSGAIRTTKAIEAPLTGASIQIADTTRSLILNHSGTIATLTVTLPQAPVDGQEVQIFSRSIVTALTLAAGTGETIETGHTLTALAALQNVAYIFNSGDSKWYRSR